MDVLSRTLREEEAVKLKEKSRTGIGLAGAAAEGLEKNPDFAKSWKFVASEDDEKRKAKKVWSK